MAPLSTAMRRVALLGDACRLVRAAVRVTGRGARRAGEHRPGERSATDETADRGPDDVHRVGQPGRRTASAWSTTSAPPCPLPTRPWTGAPSPGRCRPTCRRGHTSSRGGWCPADGHPVSGAFSFGVGTAAAAAPGSATSTETTDNERQHSGERVDRALACGHRSVWPATSRSRCSQAWPRSCSCAHRAPAKTRPCSCWSAAGSSAAQSPRSPPSWSRARTRPGSR